MAAFSYPATITPQTRQTTNEPTATTTAPPRRAQMIIFIITHQRWRAMLSPPRLPALWVGFHFDIASSSLSNRYTRGAISYDFAVHCSLDTGASLRWLLTGEGEAFACNETLATKGIETFTLSEEKLKSDEFLTISPQFFTKPLTDGMVISSEGKIYFVDKQASLSDGLWLVDIDGAISIRELTKLP